MPFKKHFCSFNRIIIAVLIIDTMISLAVPLKGPSPTSENIFCYFFPEINYGEDVLFSICKNSWISKYTDVQYEQGLISRCSAVINASLHGGFMQI